MSMNASMKFVCVLKPDYFSEVRHEIHRSPRPGGKLVELFSL